MHIDDYNLHRYLLMIITILKKLQKHAKPQRYDGKK